MSDPGWPEYARTAAFLAWLVLSGAGTARWLLGAQGSRHWIWWSPALGMLLVLFTVNLASWAFPGAAGVWVGLALAGLVAFGPLVRARMAWRPTLRADQVLGAGLLIGLYVAALANRTRTLFFEETFHLPLTATMAEGNFPPVTPFTPDVGAAYHYAADLLATAAMVTGGTPAWFGFYFVSPFTSLAFAAAAYAFARDLRAGRVLAAGVAAIAAYGTFTIAGVPNIQAVSGEGAWTAFWTLWGPVPEAHTLDRVGPYLMNEPHFPVGFSATLLAVRLVTGSPSWATTAGLAASIQMIGLGEVTQIVPAAPLLGVAAAGRAFFAHGTERLAWLVGVLGAALLVALGGGVITDGLFRGASAGAQAAVMRPDFTQLGAAISLHPPYVGQLTLGLWAKVVVAAVALALARSATLTIIVAIGILAAGLELGLRFEGGEIGRFAQVAGFWLGFAGLTGIAIWLGRASAPGRAGPVESSARQVHYPLSCSSSGRAPCRASRARWRSPPRASTRVGQSCATRTPGFAIRAATRRSSRRWSLCSPGFERVCRRTPACSPRGLAR